MKKKHLIISICLATIFGVVVGSRVVKEISPLNAYSKDDIFPDVLVDGGDFSYAGGDAESDPDKCANFDLLGKLIPPLWGRHLKVTASLMLFDWGTFFYSSDDTNGLFEGRSDTWATLGFTNAPGNTHTETRDGIPCDDSLDQGFFFCFRNVSRDQALDHSVPYIELGEKDGTIRKLPDGAEGHTIILSRSESLSMNDKTKKLINVPFTPETDRSFFTLEVYRNDGNDYKTLDELALSSEAPYTIKFLDSDDNLILSKDVELNENHFISSEGLSYFGSAIYEFDSPNQDPEYVKKFVQCTGTNHRDHRSVSIKSASLVSCKFDKDIEMEDEIDYTGKVISKQKFPLSIYNGDTKLFYGTDYDLMTIPDKIKEPGEYQLRVIYRGMYKGYDDENLSFKVINRSSTSSSSKPVTTTSSSETTSTSFPISTSSRSQSSSKGKTPDIFDNGCFGTIGTPIFVVVILVCGLTIVFSIKKKKNK